MDPSQAWSGQAGTLLILLRIISIVLPRSDCHDKSPQYLLLRCRYCNLYIDRWHDNALVDEQREIAGLNRVRQY